MTTEKIQFFMSDLAYKLEVGEIKEIHIAEQNGRKVLRLECEKIEQSEYKTVYATKSAKPVQKRKEPVEQKEKTLPQKLAAGAADFLFNPARNKGKFGGGGFGR
jgi:hypothetical protein